MKTLSVVVAGTGDIKDLEIQPGTTAGDVLHQLNLQDYLLSKGPNEPFFAAAESVYDKVKDGEKIFASTKAEVGLSPEGREPQQPRAAIAVERRPLPYWQEHGWTLKDNTYSGSYQTPYAAFQ